MSKFKCNREGCGKSFTQRCNLLRHIREHDFKGYECTLCTSYFSQKSNLEHHINIVHSIRPVSGKRKREEEFLFLKRKVCNTCQKITTLVENTSCCQNCLDSGTYCKGCHRSLPIHCFSSNNKCNGCKKKMRYHKICK